MGFSMPGKASLWLVLLLLIVGCNAQTATGNLSSGAMLGIAFGVILATAIAFIVVGCVLHRKNKIRTAESDSHPSWPLRIVKFFFGYVFFELLTLPFTIAGLIQIYQDATWQGSLPPITQGSLDATRIAYIVFVVFKYLLCIFVGFMENWGPAFWRLSPSQQEQEVKNRYGSVRRVLRIIPPTWVSFLESIIFVPLVALDGMLNNGQQLQGPNFSQLIPYDVVILLALDSILYLKMQLIFNMEVHGRNPYYISDIMYQMVLAVCTLAFTFLFVTYHLQYVNVDGFDLTRHPYSIVILVVAIQHNFSAGFTSMLLQAIIHRSRALANSDAKVKYINIYIKYFSRSYRWMFINLCMYVWSYACYIIILIAAALTLNQPSPGLAGDPAIRGMTIIVSVLAILLTAWLLLNLVYGTMKRLGSYFPRLCGCCGGLARCFQCFRCSWLYPIQFNCSSYAAAMNQVLGDCSASFRLDSDAFCR